MLNFQSLNTEQQRRIEQNRLLALQKRAAKLGLQSSSGLSDNIDYVFSHLLYFCLALENSAVYFAGTTNLWMVLVAFGCCL